MGRTVQVRTSYANDARFLLRLIEAVKKDTKMSAELKKPVIDSLKYVAQTFLESV